MAAWVYDQFAPLEGLPPADRGGLVRYITYCNVARGECTSRTMHYLGSRLGGASLIDYRMEWGNRLNNSEIFNSQTGPVSITRGIVPTPRCCTYAVLCSTPSLTARVYGWQL